MSLCPPVCPGLCTCQKLEQSPNKCLLLRPCDPLSCLLPNLLSTGNSPLDKSQVLASLNLSTLLRLLDTALCSPQISSLAQPNFITANLRSLTWKAEMEGKNISFNLPMMMCHHSLAYFLSPILTQITPTFCTGSPKN